MIKLHVQHLYLSDPRSWCCPLTLVAPGQANVAMLESDAAFTEANVQHIRAVSRAATQLSAREVARLQSTTAAMQV